ncbi:MAG: YchJ family metal-binding protein [Pseudohongiellaceae bacterium]|nr:YchJ family metal-binding protein [Pseudohongiellaceae bacterium]
MSQLMRSRYCAYYLGGYGDYLYRTWHPSSRGALSAAELSRKDTDWQSLEIIDSAQHGNLGTVEFIAYFKDSNGHKGRHHEKSNFMRQSGQWLYCDAEFVSFNESD